MSAPGAGRRPRIAGILFLAQAGIALIVAVSQALLRLDDLDFVWPLVIAPVTFAVLVGLTGLAILRRTPFARPVGCAVATICVAAYVFVFVSISFAYGDYGFGPLFALVFAPIFLSNLAIALLLLI